MNVQLLRSLPSADDLSDLPARACMAWGIRCVLRVNELLVETEGEGPVGRHVNEALRVCDGLEPVEDERASIAPLLRHHATRCSRDGHTVASLVAMSALQLLEIGGPSTPLSMDRRSDQVSEVGRATFFAALAFAERHEGHAGNGLSRLVDAMNADMENLLQASCFEHWNDDTPVPQEWFGTLWLGVPPGFWPAQAGVHPTRGGSRSSG